MFDQLKALLQQRYDSFPKEGMLFYKDVDRDEIWQRYINAFSAESMQSHNCNSCKSFMRQFGGLVAIVGTEVHSIWDLDLDLIDEEYRASIAAVRDYIALLPITNVFLTPTLKAGTDRNVDSIKDVVWTHFSLVLSNQRTTRETDIPSKLAEIRSNKDVFKRGLAEITADAVDTTLELIAQNSLYRGKEFEAMILAFQKFQRQYLALERVSGQDVHDVFAWLHSTKTGTPTGIRNSAIGTLLVNLSEGMDLDTAVRKYEAVVAPSNYKRPTALITPRMVEQAREKIQELGFIDSLERRFANATDVSAEHLLFADRSKEAGDVFSELSKEAIINPRSFSKVEEVTIAEFVEKVLPTAKGVEVLLESGHLNNLVSLLTAQHPEAPSMFKWNNPFSWTYTGGTADSIKERVKAAGGNVEGVLRFSIQWNDSDTPGVLDFDAHAFEPGGEHIYYSTYKGRQTPMSGMLDVDMISPSTIGVENITWSDLRKMRDGDYKFSIHNFNTGRNTGFKAQVEFNGEIFDFYHPTHVTGTMKVATVTLRNGVFSIKSDMDSTSQVSSKEKWRVKTNQFTKVSSIMLSPNHWEQAVGNKHYMFMLEGAINDEAARPFFNEGLKQELNDNRKVFEMMAGKLQVPATDNQLSGVGFSDTQSNSLIVRITGAFKRTLKIKF